MSATAQQIARSSTMHRGCALSWRVDGDGPPVVFIHGMGIGADGWTPQTDTLSSDFRCLSFDNRGFNLSQPVGEELTIDIMADDVLALLDAQGWDSAHIVSHSIGGLVALLVAARAPHRVRSLALMCTFASGAVPTRMDPRLLFLGIRTRIGTPAMRRRAFLEMVMPSDALSVCDVSALAARMQVFFSHDLAVSPPIVMKQFAATRRCDAISVLPGLGAIPTLVISAQHDPIAPPSYGSALAAAIPNARYYEMSDASHGVTIQRADEINTLLQHHLRSAETLATEAA